MEPRFHRKVLKNGMTVVLEKRDLPVVSVAFAVRNGGINEAMEEKGISHFIEHLLYKGTEKRNAKQIAEEIERNGGELNGFTSEEITAYWCKMPSRHLDVALDVLGDIVRNPKFDEKEIEKERKVIFEEIKLYHDNPIKHVFTEIQKCLYGDSLSIDIIGTHETMNSLKKENIVKKFEEVYKPNQMILCVVGDADFEKLVKFAEDNFPDPGVKGRVPEQKISLKNEAAIEERTGIDQANLVFAYHVPVAGEKGSHVAQVLSEVLVGGFSSRLFNEIREKRNLAYGVKGGAAINKRFAYNYVYVGTMKENVEEVKEIILKETEKVASDLDEKELNDVKEQMIGQHQISMENSQDQMVELLVSELHGNAKDFYEFEKKIRAVKLEDVKAFAKEAVKKYSFFALVPK